MIFTQHVNQPTHNRGHTLDLIITHPVSLQLWMDASLIISVFFFYHQWFYTTGYSRRNCELCSLTTSQAGYWKPYNVRLKEVKVASSWQYCQGEKTADPQHGCWKRRYRQHKLCGAFSPISWIILAAFCFDRWFLLLTTWSCFLCCTDRHRLDRQPCPVWCCAQGGGRNQIKGTLTKDSIHLLFSWDLRLLFCWTHFIFLHNLFIYVHLIVLMFSCQANLYSNVNLELREGKRKCTREMKQLCKYIFYYPS